MKQIAAALTMALTAMVCADQDIQSSYSEIRRLRGLEKAGQLSQADRKKLGLFYHAAGQHLLFRRTMEQAIERDPGDPEPRFYLGRHYASDVSDYGKAAEYFRAAVDRRAEAEPMAYLGHSLEMLGQREQALDWYGKAALRNGCETVSLAGRLRLGAIGADRAAACKPEHPVVLRELAKALSGQGRHAEAAKYLEQVLSKEPASASAAYQLHRAYRASGDRVKADRALAEFKRLSAIYGGQ